MYGACRPKTQTTRRAPLKPAWSKTDSSASSSVRPPLPDTRGGWSLLKLGQTGSRIDYQVRVPIATSVRVLSRSGAHRGDAACTAACTARSRAGAAPSARCEAR